MFTSKRSRKYIVLEQDEEVLREESLLDGCYNIKQKWKGYAKEESLPIIMAWQTMRRELGVYYGVFLWVKIGV